MGWAVLPPLPEGRDWTLAARLSRARSVLVAGVGSFALHGNVAAMDHRSGGRVDAVPACPLRSTPSGYGDNPRVDDRDARFPGRSGTNHGGSVLPSVECAGHA